MGRPPEENTARSETVAFRIGSELSLMEKRLAETGESRSRYLRRLIAEDATKARAPRRKPPTGGFQAKTSEVYHMEPAMTLEEMIDMTEDTYAVGTRWADKDSRNAGRVVEVVSLADGDYMKRVVEVEVHPSNPSAVGHRTTVAITTLASRYRRISR